jgi:hypothetical protein
MGAIGALQAGTAKERAVRAATMPLTAVAVGPIARAMGGMVPSPAAAGSLRNTMLSGARVAAIELPGAAVGATIQPLANKQILEALGEEQPDIQWDDAASSFAEQYIAGILTHGMQVGGKDYRQAVLDQAMEASRLGVPSDPSRLGAIYDPSAFPRLSDYQAKTVANKINRVASVIRKPIEQEASLTRFGTELSKQDAELIAIKQAEYIDSFVEEWNKQNPSQQIVAPWNSWQNQRSPNPLTPAQYLATYSQSSIIRKLVTGTFVRPPGQGYTYSPLSEGMPGRPYGTGLPDVDLAANVPTSPPRPRETRVLPLLSPEEIARDRMVLQDNRPRGMSFEEANALKDREAKRAEQAAYDALPMEEKLRLADALKQERNQRVAPPLSIEERLNEMSRFFDEVENKYPHQLLEKPLTPEELKQSDKLGVLLPARPGEPPRSMHPDALAMKLRREMEGHFPRPIESSESWNGRTAAETDEIFKEISEAVPKWIDSRDNGGMKGRRFSSFEEFMAALAEGPEPIMANTAYPELTNNDVISLLRWRSTFGGAAKTDAELTPTLSTEQKITSGLWTREDAPEVKHDIQRPPEEDLQEVNTRRFIQALNIAFGKKSRRGGRYLSRYTDSEGNVKERWINLPKEVLTKRVEFEGRTVDVPILELVDFIRTYGVVPAGRKTQTGRSLTRQQKLFMESEAEIAGAKDSDLYNERTWSGNRTEFRPKSPDEFDEYGGTQEPFPRESDIYLKHHQRLAYDRAHYPRRLAASKRAIVAFDKKHKEVYSRTFRISNSTTGTGGSGKKIPAAMRGKGFDGKPESDMSNTKPGKYGWLGNPFKWEGNGGPEGVSREQAVAQFEELFLDKVETDEAFANAVRSLRGREVFYYQGDVEGSHVKVIQKWLLDQNGGGELPTGRPGFPRDPAFSKKPHGLTPRRITVRKPSWEDIDTSRKAAIYKNERGEYEIDNEFASVVIPSMKYAGIKIKLDPDTGKTLFQPDDVTPQFAPEDAPLGITFEHQPKTDLFKPVHHSDMWKSKEGYEHRFPTVTFTSGNRPVGADRIGIDVDAVTASITPDRKAKTPAKTTIAKIRETAEWPQASKPLGGTQLIDLEAVMSSGRVQEAAFLKKLGQGTDLIEKLDPAKSIDGDAMSIPKMFRAGHYFRLDDVPDTEYGTRFRNQINQDGIRYLDEEINKYLTDPNEAGGNLKYFFDEIERALTNNDAPGVPSKVAEISVPGSGQTTGKSAHELARRLTASLKAAGSISGITDNSDFQKLPLRTQVDVVDAISNAIIPEGQAGGNIGSRAMFDTPKMVKQPDGSIAPKMIKLAYGIAHSTIFPEHQLPAGTYHGTSEKEFARIRSATIRAAAYDTPVPQDAKDMKVASYYAPSHRPYIRIPEHSTITDAKNSKQQQSTTPAQPQPPTTPAAAPPPSKKSINIYYSAGENAILSNLAPRPFYIKQLDGTTRPFTSVEHAYQTYKSGAFDQETYDKYFAPGARKKISGNKGTKTDNDYSFKLMEKLIRMSLEQNPDVAKALLDTGDAQLTHKQDKGVWQRAFPEIMMRIREELRAKESK